MEKSKKRPKKNKNLNVKIVGCVITAVLLISCILAISCGASGMGAIYNESATHQYNSLIIDQYTFRKLSPHVGSDTSIAFELMKFNTNKGNVTGDIIEFGFEPNELQGFQFGNTSVSVVQELGYELHTDERTHFNNRPINVCKYDFYAGKQYENGVEKVNPYGLDLVTEHVIKSNFTTLYTSDNELDPYNTGSYYIYFTTNYDIWRGLHLSDEFQNEIIIEYDVLQPQYELVEDGLTGVMSFKQIEHAIYYDVLEDNTAYNPFNEINSLIYDDKIDISRPVYITDLTIKLVCGGEVASPGDTETPIFRINIGSPNDVTSNAFNALSTLHVEYPVGIVDFEDVSWVDWIITQLSTLMKLEFAGGLTMGVILFFILSVGLLIFLIKMFAGG